MDNITINLYVDNNKDGVPDYSYVSNTAITQNGMWSAIAPVQQNTETTFVAQATDGYRKSGFVSISSIREGLVAPTIIDPVTAFSVSANTYLILGTHPENGRTISVYRSYQSPTHQSVFTTTVSNGVWSVLVTLELDKVNQFSITASYSDGVMATKYSSAVKVFIYQGNAMIPPVVTSPSADVLITDPGYTFTGTSNKEGSQIVLYVDNDKDGNPDYWTFDSIGVPIAPIAYASTVVSNGYWTITSRLLNNLRLEGYQQSYSFVVKSINGAESSQYVKVPTVTVLVHYPPPPTINVVKTTSKGISYFTITLTNGGVAPIEFRFEPVNGTIISGGANAFGAPFQPYTGPITIQSKGTAGLLEYMSMNVYGWVVEKPSQVLQ